VANGKDVSPTWRVLTAQATGVAHHAHRGYEDALAVVPADARKRPRRVASVAVADGHGHARHFRSSRGSELAVRLATEKGAELAAAAPSLPDADAVLRELTVRAAGEVVAAWRAAVAQDLAADPPTAAELVAAGYSPNAGADELIYTYGATMILAVVLPGWLLCAQIGDGDVLVVTTTGKVLRPIATDDRLDGVHTTSLCQPDAAEMMRYAVVRLVGAGIAAIMLATDGYGNAQARDDWEGVFGADLAALAAVHGIDWIGRQLPRWAEQCASSQGSGDDVTVGLLIAADAPWTPEPYVSVVSNLLEERTVPVSTARQPLLPGGRPVNIDQATVRSADQTVLVADQTTVLGGERTAVIGDDPVTVRRGDNTTVINVDQALLPRIDRGRPVGDDATVVVGRDDATVVVGGDDATVVVGGDDATVVVRADDRTVVVGADDRTVPAAQPARPQTPQAGYAPPAPYPAGPQPPGRLPPVQQLRRPPARTGPTGWQLVQVGVLAGIIAGGIALLLLLFVTLK
jgi:serine/threonine protein phosphatase PrpC